MKGYVEVTVSEEIKQKIERLLDSAIEFYRQHLVTPKGEWKEESAWFGLTTKKVWYPKNDIESPFGIEVHRGWYFSVAASDRAMPRFEFDDDEVLNVSIGTDKNYEGMVALRHLLKNKDTILIDNSLARILNRVIEHEEK